MNEEIKKKVDEDWKSQMSKEQKEAESAQQTYHKPSFTVFLSSLSMQAMIAIGKLENPLNGKTESNLEQGRYLIDTLEIIKEKTTGNLSKEETELLDECLFNLRMAYVEVKQK